jgi:hypothetical protein
VPAGKFDTFKVEITADGTQGSMTIWVDKQTHNPVRVLSALATMGGATMTAELMP